MHAFNKRHNVHILSSFLKVCLADFLLRTMAAVAAAPIDVVKGLLAAFLERDLPKAFSVLSPDVEIVQSTEVPWGGHYRGHEGARQFFGTLAKHVASRPLTESFVQAGNTIVSIGVNKGTVLATGTPFQVPFAHVWTVSGGLITHIHFIINHSSILPLLVEKPASSS